MKNVTLARAADGKPACSKCYALFMDALFMTATNVNFDEVALTSLSIGNYLSSFGLTRITRDVFQLFGKKEPCSLSERGRIIVERQATEECLYRDEEYADDGELGTSIARWYFRRSEGDPEEIESSEELPTVLRWLDK